MNIWDFVRSWRPTLEPARPKEEAAGSPEESQGSWEPSRQKTGRVVRWWLLPPAAPFFTQPSCLSTFSLGQPSVSKPFFFRSQS